VIQMSKTIRFRVSLGILIAVFSITSAYIIFYLLEVSGIVARLVQGI
jgi:hypothetical protein